MTPEEITELRRELEELRRWKQSALTVDSWWAKIDAFVRTQPDVPLGKAVADTALEWLHEWRAYKDGLK
jgi:hypothetical protein